jgi:hypothetical protein
MFEIATAQGENLRDAIHYEDRFKKAAAKNVAPTCPPRRSVVASDACRRGQVSLALKHKNSDSPPVRSKGAEGAHRWCMTRPHAWASPPSSGAHRPDSEQEQRQRVVVGLPHSAQTDALHPRSNGRTKPSGPCRSLRPPPGPTLLPAAPQRARPSRPALRRGGERVSATTQLRGRGELAIEQPDHRFQDLQVQR